MDVQLLAYVETAYNYFLLDKLDLAMQVVTDAFAEKGWPEGGWTELYNELVCEYDARQASDIYAIDDQLSVELDRGAPEETLGILKSASAQARAKVASALEIEFRKPILVTVFLPDAPLHFIYGEYGYMSARTHINKVCVPRDILISHPNAEVVLSHEFTHAAVNELSRGKDVPRWLDEGISVNSARDIYPEEISYSLAYYSGYLSVKMITRAMSGSMIKSDYDAVRAAYAFSASLTQWITDHYGPRAIRDILILIGDGFSTERAVRKVAGAALGRIEAEWKKSVKPATV